MRLHHVSIPYPADQLDAGRQFYGDLLGLAEVKPPVTLSDVVWFQLDDRELHLFVEEAANPHPTGRHFCLSVDDLDAVRTRLEGQGVAIEETTPIHNRPRFFCTDPAGNRFEVTQILGEYR